VLFCFKCTQIRDPQNLNNNFFYLNFYYQLGTFEFCHQTACQEPEKIVCNHCFLVQCQLFLQSANYFLHKFLFGFKRVQNFLRVLLSISRRKILLQKTRTKNKTRAFLTSKSSISRIKFRLPAQRVEKNTIEFPGDPLLCPPRVMAA